MDCKRSPHLCGVRSGSPQSLVLIITTHKVSAPTIIIKDVFMTCDVSFQALQLSHTMLKSESSLGWRMGGREEGDLLPLEIHKFGQYLSDPP